MPAAPTPDRCPSCSEPTGDTTPDRRRSRDVDQTRPLGPAPGASSIGPYRLLEVLGKGGMGEVYRALDERDGKLVALKVLTSLGSGQRIRFRREAEAITRVRHPGIVRVFETGEAEAPWLAMELVTGRRIDVVLEDDRLSPAWLRRLKDLSRQLLEALAAMHEAGIVHRDLKPSNLLVTPDGRVKVVDFGVAHLHDASADLSQGRLVGTYSYLSPEQASGQPVDARTDLYGLGVVLYEVFAGRTPFAADNLVALLGQILNQAPRPLAEVDPRVPGSWDRFVRRLLAKEPERRLQSARQALDAVGGLPPVEASAPAATAAAAAKAPGDADLTATIAIGRSPTLAGRATVVERLRGALGEAAAGRGATLVLVGETGVGKSRLLDELRALALAEGGIALRLAPRPGLGLGAFAWPLAELARELDRRAGPAARIRALADALAAPAADAPVPARDLAGPLVEAAETGLTALLVDDAEQADGEVRAALAAVAATARARRARLLMVLASAAAAPPELEANGVAVPTLEVPPLDLQGIEEWLFSTFPGLPHREVLAVRLAAESAGSPAALQVLGRELVRRRTVLPTAFGWRFSPTFLATAPDPESAVACLTLPSAEEALAAQVAALEPTARALLERAARRTSDFSTDELRREVGLAELDPTLDGLIRQGLLSEAPGNLLRRPPRLLAAALARPVSGPERPAPPASTPRREATLVEVGFEHLRRNDPWQALAQAEAAIAQARVGSRVRPRAAAERLRGEALRALGRRRDAGRSLMAAFSLAGKGHEDPEDAGLALLGLARLSTEDGASARALECARRAEELLRKSGDAAVAACAVERGRVDLKLARGPEALGHFGRAAALAQLGGDARGHTRAVNDLGRALHLAGDLDGAEAAFADALAVAPADLDLLVPLHLAHARLLAERGELEAAQDALARARRAALPRLTAPHAAELMLLEASVQPPGEDAVDRATEAVDRARNCERLDFECEAMLVLCLALGGTDASMVDVAVRAAELVKDPMLELRARLVLNRVLRRQGERRRLAQELDRADQLRARLARLQGSSQTAFLTRPAVAG